MPHPAQDSPSRGQVREGVRSRTRRAVRAEVSAVAMQLFVEHGFDNTTVEQIAAEAGMSRSTFFRYFPTKEDVVLGEIVAYGELLLGALTQRPESEPLWTALRMALEPVLHPEDVEQARRANRMFTHTASLKIRHHEKTLTWHELLVPEVARRLGLSDTTGDPRAAALTASALACYGAAMDAWTKVETKTPLAELLDIAMGAVQPRP